MKVLLVDPPFHAFFEYDFWYYSHVCAHLAHYLKDRGHEAYVYEADKYFPKAKRLVFDGMSSQINAVKVGRAHAAQLDLPQALWLVNQFPNDYQVTEDVIEDPNHLGLFTRPGDFKWWLALDTIVAEWRGGGGYSQYAKIYKKWFGVMPDHAKYYYNK